MVRVNYQKDVLIKKDNQNVQDHNVGYADSTFFKVFTVPMIAGDPLTALREPNSIVIDKTTAKKYFNNTDVVGKILRVDNNTDCKITGVIKDIPRQSHFHFHFIRPRGKDNDSWLSNNTYNYILVKPGVSQAEMQKNVDATIDKYIGRDIEQQFHASLKDLRAKGNHFVYHLMPLRDIHLHSGKSYEIEANGDVHTCTFFSDRCIYFIDRLCKFHEPFYRPFCKPCKGSGHQKVAGSLRLHLITQFLTESVLLSFFSLCLPLELPLLVPLFNQLAGKEMSVATLFSTWLFPVMIALVLVVGFLAGSYPAFYLSSFQPIQVLKGKVAKGFKRSWLRSGLVVFQFFISIMLIIGTIVIYNQLDYIRSRKIGYDRNQVLVVRNAYYLDQQIHTFRNELLNIPGVANASISGDLPTGINFDNEGWFRTQVLMQPRCCTD
jgi:putative ABC transport system permease protein